MVLDDIVLIISGTVTALLAGTFFGYTVSVIKALRRLTDHEYIRAMQVINVSIINPLFMLVFLGPVILLPVAAYLASDADQSRFVLLVVAAAIYIFGVFGVTSLGNVPLNDKLAKIDTDEMPAAQLAEAREHFENPWNTLHAVRTVAGIVATVLVFIACFY